MYIGYKEVTKGNQITFFLQGAFGGEVKAATGQPLDGSDSTDQVVEYTGSHPAASPIKTQNKEELIQWLQGIIDGSNKTMQQKPASPTTGQQQNRTAATAVVAAPAAKKKEPGADSDATVSDSESESDSSSTSSSSSSSSSDEEEEEEQVQKNVKQGKKGTATATTSTEKPSSTFHFVSYRNEVGRLSDNGDPPRRMWHWLLKDAQGREHIAVETSKWEPGKKRFTYSAMPPFNQVKPMECYNKRDVVAYLNQFVPPNARHTLPYRRVSAGEATTTTTTTKETKKKAPATGIKKSSAPQINKGTTTATPQKGKKVAAETSLKNQPKQTKQQQQQERERDVFITNTAKRMEARDRQITELKKRLQTLRAECGIQYSLTLVGSDGSMEVVTSKTDHAGVGGGGGGAMLKLEDIEAAAAATAATDAIMADAHTLAENVPSTKKFKRLPDGTFAGDGTGEQTKRIKRGPPEDPDVAALFKSIQGNDKIYLTGKWMRDPLPPHPLEETLETFQVAEDCGEESDRKILLDKLTVGLRSVEEAGPGATSDPPKESDILVVLDSLPEHVSGSEVELQPVWGIDSYTRCLLLDALKCCFDSSDEVSRDQFIDVYLLPALNGLGDEGWDIQKALTKVERKSTLPEEVRSAARRIHKAFEGLEEYFNDGIPVKPEARKHVRAHPKGEGVIVTSAGGLAAGTFLGEYVGELYTAWRWAEREVSRRKLNYCGNSGAGHASGVGDGAIAARRAATRMGASSEYYNIVLERPKADPRGYDVMYVDAVQKGNFVSRLSHSCNPNCRSVTVAVGGRLTVGIWTTRAVAVGEELTVDFAGETDLEREGNAAVCLCGSALCRGTFLYVTPGLNSPLNSVVASKLTFPDRCGMILHAAGDPNLSFEESERLRKHGFKELLLFDGVPASSNELNNDVGGAGGGSGNGNPSQGEQVPLWLQKWLVLALEFVEMESAEMQSILTTTGAPSGGSGGGDRDENLSYTEEETADEIEHMLAGRVHSLAVALDRAKLFLRHQSEELKATAPLQKLTDEQVTEFLWNGDSSVARRALGALCSYAKQKTSIRAAVGKRGSARREKILIKNEADEDNEGDATDDNAATAAATPAPSSMTERIANEDTTNGEVDNKSTTDIAQLVKKIEEMLEELQVKNADAARTALRRLAAMFLQAGPSHLAMHDVLQMYGGTRNFMSFTQYTIFVPTLANGDEGHKYRQLFLWGILTGWHRSTDPVDTLIAERRGCVCLPDVEVCYMPAFADGKYAAPGGDRSMLLRTLWENPRATWPRGCAANFTFRHNQKVFGTPQLDAVLREDGDVACRGLVEILQAVAK